jgi:hypothetical protein
LPMKLPTGCVSATGAAAPLSICLMGLGVTSPLPSRLSRTNGKPWSARKTCECGHRLTQARRLPRWPLPVS